MLSFENFKVDDKIVNTKFFSFLIKSFYGILIKIKSYMK